MYISDQGWRAIHQERINSMLAAAEQRRMLKQARDVAAGDRSGNGSWKALVRAAFGALRSGRARPSLEPSRDVER